MGFDPNRQMLRHAHFYNKGGEPTFAASQHYFLRTIEADVGANITMPAMGRHHSASQAFRV
jgi:hypothetical protein